MDLPNISRPKILSQWNWGFWFFWIVLTSLAWFAAFWAANSAHNFLSTFLSQFSGLRGTSLALAPVGLLFGIILGFPQSFLLRNKLAVSRGWTRASALTCAILWALPGGIDPLLWYVATGAAIGFFQWLVLRRKFPGHSWWILIAACSWHAADFISRWLLQHGALSIFPWKPEWVAASINGLLYGLFSGFGLCYLLYYTLFLSKRARLRATVPPRGKSFAVSWIIINGIAWALAYGQIGLRVQDYLLSGSGLPAHIILEKAILEGLAALGVFFILWRQQFRNSLWWVVWSGIGAAAGIFAWTSLKLENASGIIAYGAIVGFFQWFVLSQKCRYFLLWLPIRTLAWCTALILAAKVGAGFTIDLGWGVGGIAYGLITGAFLYWQLR